MKLFVRLSYVVAALAAATVAIAAQDDDPDRTYRVGEIVVGNQVQVDPSQVNRWETCTVIALRTAYPDTSIVDNFTVRCPNSIIRQVMSSPRSIRLAGGGQAQAEASPARPNLPNMPTQPSASARVAPAAPPQARPLAQRPLARGTLDVPTVEQVIEQGFSAPDPGVRISMNWHDVQIASPRIISPGDVVAEGISPGTQYYPVEVAYGRTTTVGSFTQTREVTQYYMFYRDEFGRWAGVPAAHSGNHSEIH